MKILLDPVLTAEPSKCSTTIQFMEFVQRTLKAREDVFFYWIVPTYVPDEQMSSYPDDPRITYVRIPRSKDRVRDYITMGEKFEEMIAFNGTFWDFDVLVTVRSALVPMMRIIMNSPRTRKQWWTKEVWLIEDMPMMSFKSTVPTMIPGVHDRATLEGHLAADHSFVVSYHEKPRMIAEAKNHFTPSLVIQLSRRIKQVVTAQFEHYRQKSPDQMFRREDGKPFGLAYIGRMEKANNIVDIHDLMNKMWVMRGEKLKLLVCTVSKVVPVFDKDLVDVRMPKREEFWKIVQEEMHAFIKMPNGGGFSLSLIEPIMLGTPVLTIRTDAYESLLGKSYPFFADGPSQMAGLVKALYEDYAGQYAKFVEWQETWFKPTYQQRMADDLLYDHLDDAIEQYQGKMLMNSDQLASLGENVMVKRCAELIGTEQEGKKIVTMFDALRYMGESGEVDVLDEKTDPEDRLQRNITFSTPWQPYRQGLMLFHGYKDASVEVGHLEKA